MLKQQKFNQRFNKQQGLTLIELMVALVIFSIITISVFALYINANRAYNEDEKFARMQENGRFALNIIAGDLNMADFWGEMLGPEFINQAAVTFGADCNIALDEPEKALRYYEDGGSSSYDPTGCGLKAGTNALAIKRVANTPTADADVVDGRVYLRTNGFEGSWIDDADSNPATAGYQDWLYLPSIYFIKEDADGVPYLCRAMINIGTTALSTIGNADDDCMAEGVEELYVEFGIDTDNDGVANQYVSDVDDDLIATAVTARVYLLVRSKDEVLAYENDKYYNLGNLAQLGPYNDSYYRRVYNTTVTLRNPLNAQKF